MIRSSRILIFIILATNPTINIVQSIINNSGKNNVFYNSYIKVMSFLNLLFFVLVSSVSNKDFDFPSASLKSLPREKSSHSKLC